MTRKEGARRNMDRNYVVGRGRPPVQHQFKKGESGNPRGRAKGIPSIQEILKRELRRKITITESGVQKQVTVADGLVKRWIGKALSGDNRSLENLLALLERHDAPAEMQDAVASASDEQVLTWVRQEFDGEDK